MDPLIFAIGTLGFWGLVVVGSLLLLACIEYECGWWALLILITSGLILKFGGGVDYFSWVVAHPGWTALLFAGYFVVGTLWSIGKWWFYCRREREKYDDAKDSFLKSHAITSGGDIPTNLKLEWDRVVRQGRGGVYDDEHFEIRPMVTQNKMKIYMWITYWPWSMLWTLINDPIKRLVRNIYRQIKDMLQRISDKMFAGTEKDLLTEEERTKLTEERDKAIEARDAARRNQRS